jgi:phage terminase Nu1 subunit (DNA packaging protein)
MKRPVEYCIPFIKERTILTAYDTQHMKRAHRQVAANVRAEKVLKQVKVKAARWY